MTEGKNYTSNLTRLTKHLDKLKSLQESKPVAPIMIHLSPTNNCNLNCSYCCYGNREKGLELDTKRAMSAITQFSKLGTKGLEQTGGGEGTMHPDIVEITQHAKDEGMDIGLITNGIHRKGIESMYKNLQWMRISLHGIENPKLRDKMSETINNAREQNPDITLSSVIIGKHANLEEVVKFTDKHQLPTRVTSDLTSKTIDADLKEVKQRLENINSQYLFLSDFNINTVRNHNRCYAHHIKPFIFTDGNVYSCPSIGLSPDNERNINDKFKICSIEDITETYSKPSKERILDCRFCKYADMNHFIDDLKKPLIHKNFA